MMSTIAHSFILILVVLVELPQSYHQSLTVQYLDWACSDNFTSASAMKSRMKTMDADLPASDQLEVWGAVRRYPERVQVAGKTSMTPEH